MRKLFVSLVLLVNGSYVFSLSFDPRIICPAGFTPDSAYTAQESGNTAIVRISCTSNSFAEYNYIVDRALLNPSQATEAEATALNSNYTVALLRRFGPRFKLGYRELATNTCAVGFQPGTFHGVTETYWNARAGDAIISRSPNGIISTVLGAVNQTYTHSGMALGRYMVRHNTAFADTISSYIENEDDPTAIQFNSNSLQNSGPGIINQSVTEVFTSKELINQPDNRGILIRPLDEVTNRPKLTAAANAGQQYFSHYNWHGYSETSGNSVCSLFVRDMNIKAGNLPGNVMPDLSGFSNDEITLEQRANLEKYNNKFKAWAQAYKYTDIERSKAAQKLYDNLYAEMFPPKIDPEVDASFADAYHDYDIFGFIIDLFGPEKQEVKDTIKAHLSAQFVNCMGLNQCDNANVPSSAGGMGAILDAKSLWPPDVIGEGYSMSPDNLMLWGEPYGKAELLQVVDASFYNIQHDGSQYTNYLGNYHASVTGCAKDYGTNCECDKKENPCPCISSGDWYFDLKAKFFYISRFSRDTSGRSNNGYKVYIGFNTRQNVHFQALWREEGKNQYGGVDDFEITVNPGELYVMWAEYDDWAVKDDTAKYYIHKYVCDGCDWQVIYGKTFKSSPIGEARFNATYVEGL